MIRFLDLHKQYESIKTEIDSAITDVIRETAFVGNSSNRFNKTFEENFARFQHADFCVGMANGTDALEIAIEALDFPGNSEIIVPANSFIASSEAVTRSGHRVVFSDINPESYTLDINDVRRRITSQTRAILAVHLYGHPCEMDELLSIAQENDIKIIEDCAQAHAAEYHGKRIGSIGDVGTFSFFPGKNLGAYGDGGAITTNNAKIAQKCRMIANHGRTGKYDHEFEGRNSRLDGMQAAILDAKLKHLDSWIDARNQVADSYREGLASLDKIILPSIPRGIRHAFHLFVIRTPNRDKLQSFLKQRGIDTGVHYPVALPKLQAYAHHQQDTTKFIANEHDKQLLSLPIGEHLTHQDTNFIIESIRAFFETKGD